MSNPFGKLLGAITEHRYLYNTVKQCGYTQTDDTMVIVANDKSTENFLKKQENFDILKKALQDLNFFINLKIHKVPERETLTIAQKVEQLFGEKVQIIND